MTRWATLTLSIVAAACSAEGVGDGVDAGADTDGETDAGAENGASGKWSMGYYASWKPDQYPIEEIEWSGLTHIALAFYMPDDTGALHLLGGDPGLASELVHAAHANKVAAVASIGGADSDPGFQGATAPETMETFIANLIDLVDAFGYDGVDIDWEPMAPADQPVAADIAVRLREARPGLLLTIPVGVINVNLGADLSGFGAIAAAYDQLNLMSYGLSGAWQGWRSWHSSPLYHELSSTPVSIDSTVAIYTEAGVPPGKLGIGIGFYGLCYGPPVRGPAQELNGATILASDSSISYAHIMESYYDEDAYRFDALARVPYLTFDEPAGPSGCTFISYDDEASVGEKANYIKENGLGGVIMWELNEGYLEFEAPGSRNPMLEAIRESVLN